MPWAPVQKPKKVTKPKRPAPAGSAGSVIDAFNQGTRCRGIARGAWLPQAWEEVAVSGEQHRLCRASQSARGGCIHTIAQTLANGHQNDAFDVFHPDHNGNQGEAVKAAARLLGIERESGPQCSRALEQFDQMLSGDEPPPTRPSSFPAPIGRRRGCRRRRRR